MAFGVLLSGFSIKKLEDLLTEIQAAELSAINRGMNVADDSVLGQINGVFSNQIAESWDVTQAVYNAMYPDTATGISLDNLAALTGAVRQKATRSQVTLRLNLQPGTTVQQGSIVSVGALGARFVTVSAAINADAVEKDVDVVARSQDFGPIAAPAYSLNTIVTPVTGWTAKAAVTSSAAGPFAGITAGDKLNVAVDGLFSYTVTLAAAPTTDQVVDAINAIVLNATAKNVGGKVRISSDTDGQGSSIQISAGAPDANAQLGFATNLLKGLNPEDAIQGTNLETDPEFRLRRQQLLAVQGAGTPNAIRADVLKIEGVNEVRIIENDTHYPSILTDAKGDFAINDGDALELTIDGVTDVTVIFTGTGIPQIFDGSAPAQNVADVIDAALFISVPIGSAVKTFDDRVRVFSRDPDGSIEITGGNAAIALDFLGSLSLPPHSFEVIVQDDAPPAGPELDARNLAIATAIYNSKPAGIQTAANTPGDVTVNVTDAQNVTHPISFARAEEITIFVELEVVLDAGAFEGGETQAQELIKQTIVDHGNELHVGDNVVLKRLECAPFDITGVLDVLSFRLSTDGTTWVTTNIAISGRQIARFDTSRVVFL